MWLTLTFLLAVAQAGAAPEVPLPPAEALAHKVDPAKYVLGPGDALLVSITGPVSETHQVRVGPDGKVVIPVLGPFEAAGKTVKELEAEISKVLPDFYKDAKLTIQLIGLRRVKIYILGEVERPGIYAVPALTRLSEAVSRAALPRAPLQQGEKPALIVPGIAPTGSYRRVELRRGGKVVKVDLFKVLREGRADLDPVVEAGDVIFVPLRGRLVTIEGQVFSPGTYELLPEEGLSDLIRMAGGLLPTASKAHIRIERRVGEGRKLIFAGEKALKEPLRDGDLVVVPSIEEFRGEVEVKGAVRRPGKYKLAQRMTVADLVRLAGGLTSKAVPEGAYILRPEKGKTKLFFLRDVGTKFALKDGDVLTIPTIEEVQGRVEIKGAVRKPGGYPLVTKMTLGDLIRLAGGLTPRAVPEGAYVLRPEEGGTRLIFAREAGLGLSLSDGDTVYIPTIEEVQGRVEIKGAVRKPDKYPLPVGATLRDLIELAGGLRPEAVPKRAYIRRVEEGEERLIFVRDLKRPLELKDGDVVYIPALSEVQGQVEIAGAVRKPGGYPLAVGMTVGDLVELAGGLLPDAAPTRATVTRSEPGREEKVLISLKPEQLTRGAKEPFLLQDGDAVNVPSLGDVIGRVKARGELRKVKQMEAKLAAAAKGQGAAPAPPAAEFETELRSGMRVADLVILAGGLTPDAAPQHAYIERLGPGDKKEVVRVNLTEALERPESKANVPLRPGDVLVVPPLSNFQDRVVVIGEVQGKNLEHVSLVGAPVGQEGQGRQGGEGLLYGVYVLRRGETLKDVILSVGGLTAKADPFNAYVERADEKGSLRRIKVDLFRLLVLGDESQNIVLRNGDRIVVPPIEDRVYVMGEVRSPGAFPYRPRATIADYIGEAGGFTERARPSKGLLIRTEDGKRVAVRVDLGKAMRGKGPYVKSGDIIIVPRAEFKGWRDVVELLNSLAVTGFYVGRLFR